MGSTGHCWTVWGFLGGLLVACGCMVSLCPGPVNMLLLQLFASSTQSYFFNT